MSFLKLNKTRRVVQQYSLVRSKSNPGLTIVDWQGSSPVRNQPQYAIYSISIRIIQGLIVQFKKDDESSPELTNHRSYPFKEPPRKSGSQKRIGNLIGNQLRVPYISTCRQVLLLYLKMLYMIEPLSNRNTYY